jgi:hypothetical protein
MKRAFIVVAMLLLLGTTVLQTIRANYWRHMAESKTAEYNRAIALNESSFQKSSTDERAVWMQIRDHLWRVHALEEQRLDNRRSLISTPREIQLITSLRAEIQAARDQTQELLNAKYSVIHLSTDNH